VDALKAYVRDAINSTANCVEQAAYQKAERRSDLVGAPRTIANRLLTLRVLSRFSTTVYQSLTGPEAVSGLPMPETQLFYALWRREEPESGTGIKGEPRPEDALFKLSSSKDQTIDALTQ